MRSEAGLDMRNRDVRGEGSESCSKRAGRIALNNDEIRLLAKLLLKRCSHCSDMPMRVGLASAEQLPSAEAVETKIAWAQVGVLPREDERRRKLALGERVRDGGQFYGFRPGADDQPNIGETQSSP